MALIVHSYVYFFCGTLKMALFSIFLSNFCLSPIVFFLYLYFFKIYTLKKLRYEYNPIYIMYDDDLYARKIFLKFVDFFFINFCD